MFKSNPFLKIGLNTALQYSGRIISAALSAFSIFLLTRYLGVSGYGNFSLIFAYLTFFAAFPDFGMQTTIVNKLLKKEVTKDDVFGTYLVIKAIMIIFTTGIALIFLIFMPYSMAIKLAIIFSSFGVAIGSLGGFGNTFFQFHLRVDLITIIDVVNKLISVLLILLFITLKLNFFFILSSVLISNIVTITIMFLALKKHVVFSLKFDRQLAIQLIKQSAPLGIAAFLSISYFKLDAIMLSVFKGSTQVGFYSLAYKIFENVLIIWSFYMTSFFPFLSKFFHEHDEASYKKLIRNSVAFSIFLALGVMIFGFILSPLLIRIFGGEEFVSSVLPLRILLFSSLFVFINAILYNVLFVKGKTKLIIVSLVLSLLFNFIANLFIIPRYGYIGASLTTLATEILLFACYVYFVKFGQGKHSYFK